jgi:hypothetical protein
MSNNYKTLTELNVKAGDVVLFNSNVEYRIWGWIGDKVYKTKHKHSLERGETLSKDIVGWEIVSRRLRIEEGKYYRDENGNCVGPMVGDTFKWVAGKSSITDPDWTNWGEGTTKHTPNLVAEWDFDNVNTENFIKEMSYKKILEGRYNTTEIVESNPTSVWIRIDNLLTEKELRETSTVLNSLADAICYNRNNSNL